jgi:CubicO group peptidase (beta-lactamase class C family)
LLGRAHSFIYNNLLYASVGKIIGENTGEDWKRLFSSRILSPLEMSSSGFNFSQFRNDPSNAKPYFQDHEITPFDTDRLGLAGGLVSNLEDMTKWLRFNLSRTNLEARLNQYECLNVLQQPEGFVPMGQGWFGRKMCYGLGWFLGTILENRKVIFHGGNIDGYSSLVLFVPEDDVGLVILTNQSVSPYPGRLAQKILSHLYGVDLKDAFELPEPGTMPETEVPINIPDTTELAGAYYNPAYGSIFIESRGKDLQVRYESHSWTGIYKKPQTYSFVMEVFGGMKLPMNLKFVEDGLEVPFNLDPETPAVRFFKRSQ